MKVVKESKNHNIIILDDNDIIEIVTLKHNKQIIEIKCLNSSLHIENKTKKKKVEV